MDTETVLSVFDSFLSGHLSTTALKNRYKIADQKCKKAVDDFIRKEAELIDQDNLGRFYRYVNKRIVNKSGIGIFKR